MLQGNKVILGIFSIFVFLLNAIFSPANAQNLTVRNVTSSAHCYTIFEAMDDYSKDAATKTYFHKLSGKMLENNFQEFGANAGREFMNYWDVKRIDILGEIINDDISFSRQADICGALWADIAAKVNLPKPQAYDFEAAKIAMLPQARIRSAMTCSVAYIFDGEGGQDTLHPEASKASAEAVGREWARLKGEVTNDEKEFIIKNELVRQSIKVKNFGATRIEIVSNCDQIWGKHIQALKAALDAERAAIKTRDEAAKAAEAKRQAEIAANRPKFDAGYCETLDKRAAGFMYDWINVLRDTERSLSDKRYAYDRIKQHLDNTRIEAEHRGCTQTANEISKSFETWERP